MKRKWLREEMLCEKAPALLSPSPKWFKFSEYEVFDTDLGLYIGSKKNSKIEYYEPFKLFPAILEDYLRLVVKLRAISRFKPNVVKASKEERYRLYLKEKEYQKTKATLPFVQKYGLFGLFYECISDIYPKKVTSNEFNAVLDPKCSTFLPMFFQQHLVSNSIIEYDKLAARFLPELSPPYPYVDDLEEGINFQKYYAEPVEGIVLYPDMGSIIRHETLLKEYERSGLKLDDPVESFEKKYGRSDITYEMVLNFGIRKIGLALSYANDLFNLEWRFNSLLSALSIMYIMNKAEMMGKIIRICQYKKCNEIIIGKKYCCPKHADAARQERCRARKKHEE